MTRIYVRRTGTETDGCSAVFHAGQNLQTGELAFKKAFGPVTSLESDLLLIASSVFAADRCTQRGEREDLTRGIELSIPVVNVGRLQQSARNVEEILRKLSNDSWRIVLRQEDGEQEKLPRIEPVPGQTLLFSGGLDSMAAALEYGECANGCLQLVSHVTKNPETSRAQKALVSLLAEKRIKLPHRQFLVSSRSTEPAPTLDHDVESSQRTRSFLYLVLAALSARRMGHHDILMIAENGQMAIHLPITQGRIGAFSTHTAHPDVLAAVQDYLQGALKVSFRIFNPYVGRTKAEVVKILWERLPESIALTTSCWRNTRLPSDATHCGICIPCFVRRVAVEFHGTDPTAYARDPWKEDISRLPQDDEGRRNLIDYAEFVVRFLQTSEADLMTEWPELYSRNLDAPSTINMYRRAAGEAQTVWARYPNLAPLLR